MALHPPIAQLVVTLAVFGASASTALAVNVMGRRPRKTLSPPLLDPQLTTLVAMVVALLSAIHLLTLFGLHK